MADKPTVITDWALDAAALKVDPSLDQQNFGWSTSDNTISGVPVKPNLQNQNAWQYNAHLWLQYLDQFNDDSLTPALNTRFIVPVSINDIDQTLIDVGDDTITRVAHGLETGDRVQVISTVTLPNPLVILTNYIVIKIDDDTFQLATNTANAAAGTQIDLTDQGTGTMTCSTNASFNLQHTDRYDYYIVDTTASDVGVSVPSMADLTSGENSKTFHVVKGDPTNNRVSFSRANSNEYFGPTNIATFQMRAKGDNVKVQGSNTAAGTDEAGNVKYVWSILSKVLKDTDNVRFIEDYSIIFSDTDVNVSDDNFQGGANLMGTGDQVQLTTTGTLPAGLSLATDYYTIRLANGLYQLAASRALALNHTAIDVTDQGTGNHTFVSQNDWSSNLGDGYTTYVFKTSTNAHTLNLPDIANSIDNLKVVKVEATGTLDIVCDGSDTINTQSQITMITNATANLTAETEENEWHSDFEEMEIAIVNSGTPSFDGTMWITYNNGTITLKTDGLLHLSGNQNTTAAGIIPARFRPLTTTAQPENIYHMDTSRVKTGFVLATGALFFRYINWAGVLSSTTGTDPFTITYTLTE